MAGAKEIEIKIIPSKIANDFVKKNHYSGKVVNNSTLHFGVFLSGVLHGVMSFGSPIDKRKVLSLVTDGGGEPAKWNEMLELNRMAFDEKLPKNSESRAISVAVRLLKKNAPHVKWILSFADGTQCGDGTIYRASGFSLTNIKKNKSLLVWHGEIIADKTLNNPNYARLGINAGTAKRDGATPLDGFQLRYVKILDNKYKLNCENIPFSEIAKQGATMYKGKRPSDAGVV